MISSDVYSQIRAPKQNNLLEQYAQIQGIEGAQSQNRLVNLAFSEKERGIADNQAVRQAYQQSGGDPNKLMQLLTSGGHVAAARAQAADIAGRRKQQDESDYTQGKVLAQSLSAFRSTVGQVNSPEMAGQYAGAMFDNPVLGRFAARLGTREESVQRNIDSFTRDPRAWMAGAAGLTPDKLIELSRGTRQNTNLGGASQGQTVNYYGEVVPGQTTSTPLTQSPDSVASGIVTRRGQDMTAGTAAAGRAQSATQHAQTMAQGRKAPPGYRFTQGGDLQAIPGGPADLKINAAGVTRVNDARDVLALLDEAEPLLKIATSSYIGAGRDQAGRVVGYGTEGAAAAASLRTIEGGLVAKMPKMSGPQSDKDVLLYKQMAGQVGDATMPAATRRAAIATIRKLNEKYAESGGGASGTFGAPAPAGGVPSGVMDAADAILRGGR